jgi:hypothetical protein
MIEATFRVVAHDEDWDAVAAFFPFNDSSVRENAADTTIVDPLLKSQCYLSEDGARCLANLCFVIVQKAIAPRFTLIAVRVQVARMMLLASGARSLTRRLIS